MTGTGGSENVEKRLSAAERRIEEVADDAAAARHLAASGDRDLADLTARVLANQQATEGVGVRIGHLEGRMTRLEGRVDTSTAAIKANTTSIDNLSGRVTKLEGRVDANTAAINNLSVQTGERFAAIDERFADVNKRFDGVDAGFADIRARLDQTAAGLDLIVKLLTPGPDPTAS